MGCGCGKVMKKKGGSTELIGNIQKRLTELVVVNIHTIKQIQKKHSDEKHGTEYYNG